MRTLLIFLLILVGCGSMEVERRLEEYRTYFNPRLNTATKQAVADKYGPPVHDTTVAGKILWRFHFSFGDRGNLLDPSVAPLYDERWKRYDDLFVEFDSTGILRKWKADIHR